ncbi:hypothetical protein [Flavobacterium sp.]|uniref:hypothetical protein n=1 Tax=Flavobacterium sp. TaxID=239 RepID=UPI0031CF50B8
MYIGLTLIFKEKDNQTISGILKSLVFETRIENFRVKANKLGNKIAKHFHYTFLGINDVFIVSGELRQGEVIGRTTYYDIQDEKNAKKLIRKLDITAFNKHLKCSLIYYCKNLDGEKFTITILTILENALENVELTLYKLANNEFFKNKIIKISNDNLAIIDFIGIESVEIIENEDLKFNVFETLYSDFENLELLTNEIISETELNIELKDIFLI